MRSNHFGTHDNLHFMSVSRSVSEPSQTITITKYDVPFAQLAYAYQL